MKIKIYGARGSMAFSGRVHTQYGGNSSCTALDIDGHTVLLDCGTGLLQFYEDNIARFDTGCELDILLTHLHLDHIIGFSMFPPLFSEKNNIRIFARSRSDAPLISQMFGVYKPPYWPVDIANITKAQAVEIVGEEPFELKPGITVTPLFIELHDKTSVFRIDVAGKSVVYLLDYEVKENMDKYEKLVSFCENADLVIFDASYLQEDYPPRRGWGHSTISDGIALAEKSGCRKMVFSHISQSYTDDKLKSVESGLDKAKFLIAYDGIELEV